MYYLCLQVEYDVEVLLPQGFSGSLVPLFHRHHPPRTQSRCQALTVIALPTLGFALAFCCVWLSRPL